MDKNNNNKKRKANSISNNVTTTTATRVYNDNNNNNNRDANIIHNKISIAGINDDDCEEPDIVATAPDVFSKMCHKFEADDKVKLKESVTRNVLIVGRSRSGKSTMYRMLKCASHVADNESIFAETKSARLDAFTVESTINNGQGNTIARNYNINIIDTPGLFEHNKIGNMSRDNESIKDIILKCLEYEVTKLNSIIFVFTIQAGINKDDVDSINQFATIFQGAEKIMSIVISRSQSSTRKVKESIIKEFREHANLKDIHDKVGGRIFFTGAFSRNILDSSDEQTVTNMYSRISSMRYKIFEYIFNSNEEFMLNRMGHYTKIKEQVMLHYGTLKEMFNVNIIERDGLYLERLMNITENLQRRYTIVSNNSEDSNNILNAIEKAKGIIQETSNHIENKNQLLICKHELIRLIKQKECDRNSSYIKELIDAIEIADKKSSMLLDNSKEYKDIREHIITAKEILVNMEP